MKSEKIQTFFTFLAHAFAGLILLLVVSYHLNNTRFHPFLSSIVVLGYFFLIYPSLVGWNTLRQKNFFYHYLFAIYFSGIYGIWSIGETLLIFLFYMPFLAINTISLLIFIVLKKGYRFALFVATLLAVFLAICSGLLLLHAEAKLTAYYYRDNLQQKIKIVEAKKLQPIDQTSSQLASDLLEQFKTDDNSYFVQSSGEFIWLYFNPSRGGRQICRVYDSKLILIQDWSMLCYHDWGNAL